MPEPPPIEQPPYVAYPRGSDSVDAERIRALADGYYGLSVVFAVNVLFVFGAVVAASIDVWAYIGTVVAMCVTVGVLAYRPARRIAEGEGKSIHLAWLTSVLLGLNALFMCGAVGVVIMQQKASNGLKRAGIKPGFFGYRKKDIEAVIAHLQTNGGGGA